MYLSQRITSIISQTFKNFEIIFLDDCSKDNSVNLARDILAKTDIPHKILINEKNSGSPFHQWNKGVNEAVGDYIWIAEADDFCEYTFLEELIRLVRSYNNVGLGYCQTRPVDYKGNVINSFNYIQYTDFLDTQKWLSEYFNNGPNEVENYLCRLCTIINVSSVLFKRNDFLKAGCVDTNYKQGGDWLTYIKILRNSNIAYTPKLLNYHRIHSTKRTSNTVANLIYFKDMLNIFKYTHKEFCISEQTVDLQFQHILRQWNDHYNGPYGRISRVNNAILLLRLLLFYPRRAKEVFKQYLKTFNSDLVIQT